MTLVHPVRGAGVHALSKFQVSSLSRKDSERVSLEMVGDRRAKRPSCAASRVSELHLAVEVAARPGEKLEFFSRKLAACFEILNRSFAPHNEQENICENQIPS